MGKSNKGARHELEKQFGKICFLEKMGIRYIPSKERRKIKGYTKYDEQITFHHIVEKAKGGEATPENGALIRGYNHRWLHTLPEREKENINKAIIQFKTSFLQARDSGIELNNPQSIDLDFNMENRDCITIKAYPTKRKRKEKGKKQGEYDRNKSKRELQELIDEELYTNDDEER